MAMKITHFGHACVLLEYDTPEPTRILIDPGAYSQGFESADDIDAVLFTHSHADHVDVKRLPALVAANPGVKITADVATAATLTDQAVAHQMIAPGDALSVAGIGVDVLGGDHAIIHCDVPNVPNNGYLIDGRILHPGDAFVDAPDSVEVLFLPVGGPWMKIGEAVDYLRTINPTVVIPIHQAGLAQVHQDLHYSLLRNLGPKSCEVLVLEHGVALSI
jgi:L-ascorbate metabolism protein UlaG (beta-lactamase superfamily)